MSSSNRKLVANTRNALGLQDSTKVSSEEIQSEIDAAKAVLSEEVKQRLDEGNVLEFDGNAAESALQNYVYLRMSEAADNGRGRGPPQSISKLRRATFEDTQKAYWRDELLKSIRRM